MDSDSDWDSFTADASVVKTNKSIASKKSKKTAAGVTVKQQSYKSPVKEKNSQVSATLPQKDKNVLNDGFKSVELVDRSHREINHNISVKRNAKLTETKKNIPYTNFQVNSPKKTNHAPAITEKKPFDKDSTNSWDDDDDDGDDDEDEDDDDTENIMENSNALYGNSLPHDNIKQHSTIFDAKQQKTTSVINNSNTHLMKPINDSKRYERNNNIDNRDKQLDSQFIYENTTPMVDIGKQANRQNQGDGVTEIRYYYEKLHYDYHTMTSSNLAITPKHADKIEIIIRRFWGEVFGALRIVVDFVIIFIVELMKFIFKSILQKLIVGILTALGDFVFKPLLSTLYNFIILPVFVLLWNVFNGVRTILQPLSAILNDFASPVALLLRSFRLFEYTSGCQERQNAVKNV